MKNLILILGLITIPFLISCKKENAEPEKAPVESYLVFGEKYIFFPITQDSDNSKNAKLTCIAPPMMFKWEKDSLIKDENATPPSFDEIYEGFSSYKLINCADSIKEKINQLIDKIPPQLFDEANKMISYTKRLDGYYIYIEVKDKSGKRRFWLLNGARKKDNLPTYLHSFMDSCHELIDLLYIVSK